MAAAANERVVSRTVRANRDMEINRRGARLRRPCHFQPCDSDVISSVNDAVKCTNERARSLGRSGSGLRFRDGTQHAPHTKFSEHTSQGFDPGTPSKSPALLGAARGVGRLASWRSLVSSSSRSRCIRCATWFAVRALATAHEHSASRATLRIREISLSGRAHC